MTLLHTLQRLLARPEPTVAAHWSWSLCRHLYSYVDVAARHSMASNRHCGTSPLHRHPFAFDIDGEPTHRPLVTVTVCTMAATPMPSATSCSASSCTGAGSPPLRPRAPWTHARTHLRTRPRPRPHQLPPPRRHIPSRTSRPRLASDAMPLPYCTPFGDYQQDRRPPSQPTGVGACVVALTTTST